MTAATLRRRTLDDIRAERKQRAAARRFEAAALARLPQALRDNARIHAQQYPAESADFIQSVWLQLVQSSPDTPAKCVLARARSDVRHYEQNHFSSKRSAAESWDDPSPFLRGLDARSALQIGELYRPRSRRGEAARRVAKRLHVSLRRAQQIVKKVREQLRKQNGK